MAKKAKKAAAKLTSRIDPAGGFGKAARWKWSVLRGTKVLQSGTVTGAQQKAHDEIADAIDRIKEAKRTGDKSKAKKPMKWGNFI